MLGLLSESWKLLVTVLLLCSTLFSVSTAPPARPVQRSELRGLVLLAIGLYSVGLLATISHRGVLAALTYVAGILTCSFAIWLSRGMRRDDGPDGPGADDGPGGEKWPPPVGPDGQPQVDWEAFERDLDAWSERSFLAR